MRIEDRIALGYAPESALSGMDHASLVKAKTEGVQLHAAGEGKPEKEGEVYWFTLSTETVNRRGDVIRQKGLDFTNWNKIPVVLHNHDDEFPVGLGTIKRRGDATLMGVQFSTANPRAVMLKAMLDENPPMPMGASIAIMPKKVSDPSSAAERKSLGLGPYGVVYEKAEVIEGTICTIPCDPNSVRNALKVGDFKPGEVDRFIDSMGATEMDMARRLRMGASEPSAPSIDDPNTPEPAWLGRFEAALERASARIEHAVRGGTRLEPDRSPEAVPNAAKGIPLANFLKDLGSEVEKRIARKD